MNITFMVGNGFDLNQGLKTGYKDFYAYYLAHDPKDMISTSIKKDYELWADLELGLGALLKNVEEENIDEYFDSKAFLEECLTSYLIEEAAKFQIIDEERLAEEFRKSILNFFGEFSTTEKNHYHNVIRSTSSSVQYQFITFNYTNVLDRIIAVTKKKYGVFSNHTYGSTTYNDDLCLPHHVHGVLGGQDMILCVDSPEQIGNEGFRNNHRIVDYMIKTSVNTALGEMKTEKAREIIDKSKYVCLFGLSIGDTDGTWWRYLIQWLRRSEDNRLVIYVRDKANANKSGTETIRFRDKIRESFMRKCSGNMNEIKVLNRIIIVSNSQIFTFKNVSTEGDNHGQT